MGIFSINAFGQKPGFETAGSLAMNKGETSGSLALFGGETSGSVASAGSSSGSLNVVA